MQDADPFDAETAKRVVDELDRARAAEYSLLSTLLAGSPDAQLIGRIAGLGEDLSPLGRAHAALGKAAARADADSVAREYFDLFIGVGRGELLPYASYYQTGFLHSRPLARVREALARIGVARADGETEPEDHAAILFEVMAGLVGGNISAPAGTDREIFETHLAPWIGRFFADLERAQSGEFYARVGALGRVFVEIESEAFALPA
ncbi:MAG: molecular chaperone TorD family protein [Methylocella sp.]